MDGYADLDNKSIHRFAARRSNKQEYNRQRKALSGNGAIYFGLSKSDQSRLTWRRGNDQWMKTNAHRFKYFNIEGKSVAPNARSDIDSKSAEARIIVAQSKDSIKVEHETFRQDVLDSFHDWQYENDMDQTHANPWVEKSDEEL